MSAEVATQNRTSEASRGTAKRGNKSRGGNPNSNPNSRGANRNTRPGGNNTKGNGTKNAPVGSASPVVDVGGAAAPSDVNGPSKIASQLASVALSDSGEEVCWICAEPVKYYSVSECNHRTCHVCALRLRALYKKTQCTFCKDPQTHVIFTTSPDALYESFTPEDIPLKDAKLSISFETQEMMEDILILLRFNCPDSECDYIGNGWGDLRLHVRASHGKLMCDVCIRHKKVFSHEHTLYTPTLLGIHLPSVAQSQRGNKAAIKEIPEGGIHPLCAFCRECFFSDDELYTHMREKHEECFICKRNEVRDQYFQNYESLERHFNNAHHPCNQPECLTHKFIVFNTLLDLKAHMVEVHGGDMTARDKKDARRIQAEFAFEEVGYGGRHGHGHGRGGGGGGGRDRERDRDHDRDPPPHPNHQQQQQQQQQAQASTSATASGPSRAAPAGGNRRREGFGGALTIDAGPAQAGPSNGGHTRTRPSSPQLANDLDPETVQRHAAFLTRLQTLAQNPSAAVPAVKAATRSYRASESSAKDLIQIIWNVLDRNLEWTASIVNAFIDLVEEDEKKQDLLASWKGFALEQRRQFPDLTPTAIGSGYAGITSGRVLNAKHATATRSLQSQQVWNRVAQAASSSSAFPPPPNTRLVPGAAPPPTQQPQPIQDRFPALGRSSPALGAQQTQQRATGAGQRSTPWSGSGGGSVATASSGFRAPVSVSMPSAARKTGQKQQAPPKLSSSLFPELPMASNMKSKPQVSGNVSLKNILGTSSGPAVAAWGSGSGGRAESASQAATDGESVQDGPAGVAGGKGKKNKGKQKQTLFTLGSFPT